MPTTAHRPSAPSPSCGVVQTRHTPGAGICFLPQQRSPVLLHTVSLAASSAAKRVPFRQPGGQLGELNDVVVGNAREAIGLK